MNFYLIKAALDPAYFFSEYAEHPEWLQWKVWAGEKIEEHFIVNLICEKDRFILNDLVAGYTTSLVVSDRLNQLLHEIEGKNIQSHPARLFDKKRNLVGSNYSHINILDNIEAFDWEKSEYTIETWDDEKEILMKWNSDQLNKIPEDQRENMSLRDFKKIALKTDFIPPNRHLFRVKSIETRIFVSEELKSKIIDTGITGVKFLSLDNL